MTTWTFFYQTSFNFTTLTKILRSISNFDLRCVLWGLCKVSDRQPVSIRRWVIWHKWLLFHTYVKIWSQLVGMPLWFSKENCSNYLLTLVVSDDFCILSAYVYFFCGIKGTAKAFPLTILMWLHDSILVVLKYSLPFVLLVLNKYFFISVSKC